jgi:hypothetical protein
MSNLLSRPPYGPRDDKLFLEEVNTLTLHHLKGSKEFSEIWHDWKPAEKIEDIPFLHSGVFKYLDLKTSGKDIEHKRLARSSSTSGISSKIYLDCLSSKLQSESTAKILIDFLGDIKHPLIVLDSSASLCKRSELSARVAAALSLQPLASEINFILNDSEDPQTVKWDVLDEILEKNNDLLVYGFSWILWLVWGKNDFPDRTRSLLKGKKIYFVHSGGWKKLEKACVDRNTFDSKILKGLDPASKVLDFYGLVEQMGVIYPLCEHNFRHIPAWADIIVRDAHTLKPVFSRIGQIQLINSITYGAPNYSVLTEDMGRIVSGDCPCGRLGKRFELLGRVPKAETRGCANV